MNKITIALPKVILSFPHLVEKQPLDKNYITTEEKRKYVATFLLDKEDDSHKKVIKEYETKLNSLLKEIKIKQNPHILIKDGDEELERLEDEEKLSKNSYKKNKIILTASNGFQPLLTGLSGAKLEKQEDETDEEFKARITDMFYSGCYVHAFIELSPYKFNDVWKGVSNRLHHVQFSSHGERLGGSSILSGASVFENYKDEDEQTDFGKFQQNQTKNIDLF